MKRFLRSLAGAAGALAVMAMLSACNSFPKAPRMGPDDFPNARAPLSRAPVSDGFDATQAPVSDGFVAAHARGAVVGFGR